MKRHHLDIDGRPGCRVGKRADTERLRSTEDERLVTCLACLRLVEARRRARVSGQGTLQGTMLDVIEGRPNVTHLFGGGEDSGT